MQTAKLSAKCFIDIYKNAGGMFLFRKDHFALIIDQKIIDNDDISKINDELNGNFFIAKLANDEFIFLSRQEAIENFPIINNEDIARAIGIEI